MDIIPLLQQLLSILGFPIPDEERDNGQFGEGTREAVRQFQALLELPTTGDLDEDTTRTLIILTGQHLLTMLPMPDLEISDDEQRHATAGDSTREAIRRFQENEGGLEVTGELDDRTLEALLEQAGNGRFSVSGIVRDSQEQSVQACTVKAFDRHAETGATRSLGHARSNADGFYTIEYTVKQIRELGKLRADLVMTAETDDGAQRVETEPMRRVPVRATVDLVLVPAQPAATWIIRGQLIDANDSVAGAKVTAFDRDFGPARQFLGKADTEPDGSFRITYPADAFLGAEGERAPRKPSPDLIFEVLRGDESVKSTAIIRTLPTGEAFVAPDELLAGIPAREDETLQIVIPAVALPPKADEYTLLWQAILPLLPDQPPADADDAEREHRVCAAMIDLNEVERRDITFVAREIEWPFRLVERFFNACRSAALDFTAEVTPAELYGLAAAGFPDLHALATASLSDLDKGLQRAAGAAVIPPVDAARATLVAELIHRRAPRRILEPAVDNIRPVLAQTLDLSGLDENKQVRLLRFAADFDGSAADFWQALRHEEGLSEHAAQVEYVMQLGALTGQSVSLMRGIAGHFPDAHSLRALTLQVDEAQMRQIISTPEIEISTNAPGANPEERIALLARSMVGLLRAADPTATIAGVAQRLSDENDSPISRSGTRLLERMATERPDFDLLTARVADFADLFDGEEAQRETAIRDVRRIQRLARISTSEANFAGLMRTQINAASDIPAMYTRSGFIAAHASALGSLDEADLTYRRAVAVSAATLTATVQAYQITADIQPYATSEKPDALATWAGLFGTVELCECEHCRSWYSPAAYLVDLLLFLEKRNNAANGPAPLDVLLERRPDIAHLQLSCENTNTTLPLIDLVNETLESYIVLRDQFDAFKGHDVRDESAAELRASPQHVEQQAYDELAKAVYPVTLPFERWLEVVRAVLATQEAPRHALMAAFETVSDAPASAAHLRRCELLGLSPRERELITGLKLDGTATEEKLNALYGLAPELTPTELAAEVATARALQERLGLTFTQLIDLMSCRLINPVLQLEGSLQQVYDEFGIDAARLKAFVTANYTPDDELAAHLVERSQTPEQLKALLDELFSPGQVAKLIIFQGIEGDPAQMELLHADGSRLTEAELRLLTTFVRLWRKLGWPMADLDRALRAFGCTDTVTPAALDNLADLTTLQAQWEASAPELLVLWSDLDTQGKDSPYQRRFQARTMGTPPDPDLRLRLKDGTLSNAEKSLGDKEVAVIRGLQWPAGDFADLLAASEPKLTKQSPTSISNLSRLVRLTTLSRMLELAPAELAALSKLAGIDPFATPQNTIAFARLAQQMQDVGLDVARLDYLLGAAAIPAGAPDDSALDALAAGIAAGLAEMRRTHVSPDLDALTADYLREKLMLLTDGETAMFVSALVAGALDKPTDERLFAARGKIVSDIPGTPVLTLVPDWKPLRDGIEAEMDERQERLAQATATLLPIIHDRLGRAIVRIAGQEGFGLDEAMAELLLEETTVLREGDGTPVVDGLLQLAEGATHPPVLRTLHRVALLVATLKLQAAELRYIAGNRNRFNGLDFSMPNWGADDKGMERWRRLADYAALRDRLGSRQGKLLDIFLAAEDERVAALTQATGWAEAVVKEALQELGLDGSDLADERAVAKLEPVIKLSKAVGAGPTTVKKWALEKPDRAQAEAVVSAARAHYGEAAWIEAAEAINDPLRERQRDALVAHLLTFPEITARQIRTVDQLFEHFLIDVGTSACTLTSRVVQANAAVQLFVQRVFLGLENRAALPVAFRLSQDAIDAEEWAWRKNYRVWEANRKIFLYPENYLLPELRDDRSPFFRELQSELSEGNLNPDQIERAVLGYLGKIETTSRLEIVGAYRQVEAFPPTDILHVFGRTMSGVPRTYYYRRLVDKEWTPWEAVTVDIQGVERDEETGVSGVHLLPVVWQGKLYVFWPQFVTKQDNEAPPEANGKKMGAGSGITVKRPEPYWEIRLAWSRHEDDRWTPKQLSDVYLKRFKEMSEPPARKLGKKKVPKGEALLTAARDASAEITQSMSTISSILKVGAIAEALPGELPSIHLQSIIDARGGLTIQLIDRNDGQQAVGALAFADSYAAPAAESATNQPLVDLKIDRGHYQGQAGFRSLQVSAASAQLPFTPLLHESDGPFVVTPLAQAGASPLDSPFFYGDTRRLYYVQLWPNVATDFPKVTQPPRKSSPRVVARVTSTSFNDARQSFTVRPASQVQDVSPWTRAAAELSPMAISRALTLSSANGESGSTTGGQFSEITDAILTQLSPGIRDALTVDLALAPVQQSVQARFHTFFHPHTATFAERLRRGGLPALLSLDSQQLGSSETTFKQVYQPVEGRLRGPLPRHHVDFSPHGPYSVYNWELFYHIPFLLADELRKAGRYADALRMIRFIFDPLNSTPDAGLERFWRVLPLQAPHQRVVELFEALEPGGDPDEKQDVLDQLARIAEHPFQPFRIARLRLGAFQKAAVMLFCDICLEAGDAMFRQDTRESVGEALQYYVMVANVLGPMPEVIRRTNRVAPQTFAELRPRLTAAGNAFVEAENELLFAGIGAAGNGPTGAATLLSVGRTLYFCIPQNDRLLRYWDTVQDRLFKLRNCMNIDGVVRQLALFAPPIDPLLLARATAAGLDLASVLADLNAPLPRYRFNIMLQKALEMAGELKSLGASLLSAIEKKEAEHLAVLRAGHEYLLMEKIRLTRQWQVSEAQAALNTLLGSRTKALHELQHYAALLGVELPTIPSLPELPKTPPETLADVQPVTPLQTNRGRFELVSGGTITLSGAAVGAVAGGLVGGPMGAAAGAALGSVLGDVELANFDTGTKILRFEQEEIWQSFLAAAYSMAGTPFRALGIALSIIPQFEISLKPLGLGGSVSFGGKQLQDGANLGAEIMHHISTWHGFQATLAGKQAGYVWRHQDLMLKFNNSALEIGQIDRQILAAQIRLEVAKNELATHKQQIEDRQEEFEFQLKRKFTNEQRYEMLERSLGKVFNEAYKLAHDLARQAERAYRFQIGDESAVFIKPNSYWDSQRRGLLCGEELFLDLKRMERSFLQQDRREYELTKHISLLQINPSALIDLRIKGSCEFELPEWLFDLDFPSHFFRRIKSVAVTVPCITGPYTNVSGRLTMLTSKVRVKAAGDGDDSFSIDPVPIQSIAISNGQNDSGMFELSFRDERYLPFEGAGVAGKWRFELPAAFRAFDYETIADLVLHFRYTAREGGGALAERRKKAMRDAFKTAQESAPLTQLFSLRHEFPSEWHRLVNAKTDGERAQEFVILRSRFPLMFAGSKLAVTQIKLLTVARTEASFMPELFTPVPDRTRAALGEPTNLADGRVQQRATPSSSNAAIATVVDDPSKATWQLKLTGSMSDLEDVLLLFGYIVG